MTQKEQHKKLGDTLWGIANDLRGAMNADDFRDYMLSFLFLRYLSHNYEESAKKELGSDYPNAEEKKIKVVDDESGKEEEITIEVSPSFLCCSFCVISSI